MPHKIQTLSHREPSIYVDDGNIKLGIIDIDQTNGKPIKAVAHSDGSHIVYCSIDDRDMFRVLHVSQKSDGKMGELMEYVVDDMGVRMVQFWNVVNDDLEERLMYSDVKSETFQGQEVKAIECYWAKL